MISSLAEGRAALAPGLPVTLVSAPGAALFAGCGWWRALIGGLRAEHPGRAFGDVLDCADAPGFAASALRGGQPVIAFRSANPALVARVEAIAASCGAEVLPGLPAALDLGERGAARRLPAWLAGQGSAG